MHASRVLLCADRISLADFLAPLTLQSPRFSKHNSGALVRLHCVFWTSGEKEERRSWVPILQVAGPALVCSLQCLHTISRTFRSQYTRTLCAKAQFPFPSPICESVSVSIEFVLEYNFGAHTSPESTTSKQSSCTVLESARLQVDSSRG